ncbi:hypothetical protein A8990_14421 [Paenibacillus taihuensis]|uniref:Uncharacterized protein n=1 Tax=Paenibacillus taihuensis TaxID=1156355 RepID=A0A3D9QU64_9BACL|nr:hypothetical protein [Paenibacillus taihuensis]REE67265.1 hypothetical protein A8990_14421 [Paenibacillus taihuensis]
MSSDLILRFWRRADGAVSIYMIVSTAAMLLLTSLLIDFARIAAFERQAELAGQSGIRSSLSAYDDRLYERYGLFGTGGSDRGELFAHAVQHNWTAEEADSFRLLDMKSEASHVDSYEVLGNHAVFKRQVLEETKYKAPIDFTLEIASKFAPIAGAMKEVSTSVKLLGEVQKLYEERERRLDEVLALQKKAAAAVSERIPSLLGATASSIVDGYGDYLRWQSEDAVLEEGEEPAHRDKIRAYSERAVNGADSIADSASQALSSHREHEQRAQAALREAKQLNASIQAAAERYVTTEGSGNYDRISQMEIAGSESASIDLNEIGQTRGAVSELVLDDSWFDNYASALSEQTRAIQQVNDRAIAFRASVRSALGGQGSSSTSLKLTLQSLQNAYQVYEDSYGPSGTVIQSREEERVKRQANDRERKANEAAASSKLGEVKRLIEQMKSAPNQEENRKAFRQVKQHLEANLQFNQAAQPEDETGDPLRGQSGETVLNSMSAVGTIFGGMADLLEDIRDPLYINEYIAHRFQAFDPKQFKQFAGGGGQQAALSDALSLENQEVEYILYGIHDPVSNIAAAYGELFALRLAVRTMEGFIECRALGHPLLVLSAAVVYGIEKAMADMATISQKGTIALSKYAPAELSYLDYLRLFLILHGNSDGRIARIIAVIEQNTDTVLSQVSTGLTGELTASVNLWFLPGLMRSFALTGILNGKVKGNRYETTRTIGWSYG